MRSKQVLVSLAVALFAGLAATIAVLGGAVNAAPSNSTYIGGLISFDTTWSAESSPYIVVDDIMVEQGVTLTIESGVEVRFDEGYELIVDGGLIAQGTHTKRITFTSNISSPTAGSWGGIRFRDSSVDSVSEVSYADIQYANEGVQCTYASPRIANSRIITTSGYGIRLDHGSPVISDNEILNTGNGMFLYYSHPSITGNTISNATTYGIYMQKGCDPTIDGNTISEVANGIYFLSYSDPTITNNSIQNCSEYGIGFRAWASSPTISNNNISNVKEGISSWSREPHSPPTISDNTLTDLSEVGIRLSFENGAVTGNYISGVESGYAIWANFDGAISENVITDCQNALYISGNPQVNFNSITNVDGYLVDCQEEAGTTIDTEYNWWGIGNAFTISEKIFDYYDDFNYAKVDYSPLLAAAWNGSMSGPSEPSILINDGAGRTMSTQVTLTLQAIGASEMLVSEDPSFADASWENYTTSKPFTSTLAIFGKRGWEHKHFMLG